MLAQNGMIRVACLVGGARGMTVVGENILGKKIPV
jgi:hypothetical protein